MLHYVSKVSWLVILLLGLALVSKKLTKVNKMLPKMSYVGLSISVPSTYVTVHVHSAYTMCTTFLVQCSLTSTGDGVWSK